MLGEERRVLPLLQALAYAAQRSRQWEQTVRDVPRPAALALLEQPEYLGDIGLANAFLEYVDYRAGLLMGRGGAPECPATYSFAHRVFQEYLAACHRLRQRSMVRTLWAHAREGEQWNLVVQLAAEELVYNWQHDNELLDLAYDLCPVKEGSSTVDEGMALWSGRMAARSGTIVSTCAAPLASGATRAASAASLDVASSCAHDSGLCPSDLYTLDGESRGAGPSGCCAAGFVFASCVLGASPDARKG